MSGDGSPALRELDQIAFHVQGGRAMERWILVAAVGLLTTVGLACSKSDSPEAGEVKRGEHLTDAVHLSSGYEETTGHESTGKAPAASHGKADAPDKVVKEFLSAAKSGDQQKLSLLLSDAARKETHAHGIDFELDSYRDATFEVGSFEYLTKEKNTAHVSCKWTDHDGADSFTHDVIWVLRKEEAGWRVVGMITRPFPDQPPVAFNYENVDELMQTKASIEQEAKRRAEVDEREKRREARRERTEK
jgi:hypothetical protein